MNDGVRWAIRLPEYENGWVDQEHEGVGRLRDWTQRKLYASKESALSTLWAIRARRVKAVLVRVTRVRAGTGADSQRIEWLDNAAKRFDRLATVRQKMELNIQARLRDVIDELRGNST